MKFVISSARAHIAETTEDEWMQEYEIAADADLVEKMVAAMVLEYVVMVNSDPSYDRD